MFKTMFQGNSIYSNLFEISYNFDHREGLQVLHPSSSMVQVLQIAGEYVYCVLRFIAETLIFT